MKLRWSRGMMEHDVQFVPAPAIASACRSLITRALPVPHYQFWACTPSAFVSFSTTMRGGKILQDSNTTDSLAVM